MRPGEVTPIVKTRRRKRDPHKGWHKARAWVIDRAGGQCEVVIDGYRCPDRLDQVHHIRRRSQGGTDDVSNLLAVCSAHHDEIHADPKWAMAMGFLRSGWGDAA